MLTVSVLLVLASSLWAAALFFPQILEPGSDYSPCLKSWSASDFAQKAIGLAGITLAGFSFLYARQGKRRRWLLTILGVSAGLAAWWLIAGC